MQVGFSTAGKKFNISVLERKNIFVLCAHLSSLKTFVLYRSIGAQ